MSGGRSNTDVSNDRTLPQLICSPRRRQEKLDEFKTRRLFPISTESAIGNHHCQYEHEYSEQVSTILRG